MIFDRARKKLIPLTPEEWVRQHCLALLNEQYQIPFSRIAVERELKFHQMRKRFDIVVFNSAGSAQCVIECKAPEVQITPNTLLQIGMYNQSLACPMLWVTNGLEHFWFALDGGMMKPSAFPERI